MWAFTEFSNLQIENERIGYYPLQKNGCTLFQRNDCKDRIKEEDKQKSILVYPKIFEEPR